MTNLKAKTAGRAMVLTERDCAIVRDVCSFQLLTREQLVRLGHFGSKTRANATLLRLAQFRYLSRRYLPAVAGSQRALYFPGPDAHRLVGVAGDVLGQQRRRASTLSDLFVAHQLLVTDIRLSFLTEGQLRVDRWMGDGELRSANLGVIPDGHVEYTVQGRRFGAFLEVDRGTETLARWQAKVTAYTRLASSGRYQQVFGRQFFRVLAVTPSLHRLTNLRRTTAAITDRIFWFTPLSLLTEKGPLGPIWLRPVEAPPQSLRPTEAPS